MEGGGFEPPKAEPPDLQSGPFDRSGTPPKQASYCAKVNGLCQRLIEKKMQLNMLVQTTDQFYANNRDNRTRQA